MDPFQQGQQQVEQKAKQSTLGCVIWIVVALVGAAGITAAAGYFLVALKREAAMNGGAGTPGSMAGGLAPAWTGDGPFSCGGNDNVSIVGVTASLPGVTAIEAGGNCQVSLVNVNLTAGVPISASGNANVTVTGGSLTGTQSSISASGNAHVAVTGAAVSGAVSRSGFAKVTGVP